MRQPRRTDGAGIHQLISECPPLDLNSVYTYLLLSEHFADTSILAGEGDQLEGFISGYLVPEKHDTLFIWQVAVHANARGKGLGKRMLSQLLQRPSLEHVRYIETTVGPDNLASRGMFNSLARTLNAPVLETPLFDRALFGRHGHEDEPLLRIGPFQSL
ncbi:diaminobutyrate acetyltransferase [Allopusillimonas ginsengisoli]|uniref:diaminobutyrate acetyltransferase n=1 Tax=Allopusillimonas ginsengisoli TaxID=453575 RepID=UPI00102190CF|nr:diaminobutyrate acetyltransferase [Allopusillimonas ginsengisoli]TEA78157.1 diaminobutyrate acetyltransferase [Allopusillimonas ginsengisoli]